MPFDDAADPAPAPLIQYDELRIEHDQGDVEIVVYNRAILLFTTDSEAVKRIHESVVSSARASVPTVDVTSIRVSRRDSGIGYRIEDLGLETAN